jgi:hypothetical protein
MTMSVSAGQVIVLGAQRSGTTEIFNVLTKVLGYAGDVESHLWPSVAAAWREIDQAVIRMGGENTAAFKHFTIGRVGLDTVKSGFAQSMVALCEKRFGPRWVDKTPGPEMICAAPVLARTLPNAKFLFMRRRGIENVLSKQRRFPGRDFKVACTEWAEAMRAWLDQRDALKGRAIEIDQMDMALKPSVVAAALARLLGCKEAEEEALATYLAQTRSEQTSAILTHRTLSLAETGWTPAQQRIFMDHCAAMMAAYNYSFEAGGGDLSGPPPVVPLSFVQSPHVSIASNSRKTHFWWEGLTFVCSSGGQPESVSVRNVPTAGHNLFEAVIRSAKRPTAGTINLTLRITLASGQEHRNVVEVRTGSETPLTWHVGSLDGPVTIAFSAEATGTGAEDAHVTIARPRLVYAA